MIEASIKQLRNAIEAMEKDETSFLYASVAWDALSSAHREVLNLLIHQGPIFDGNIPSKSARDDLISVGLAVRCCYMGEDGYTAASYQGLEVFKAGKARPFPLKKAERG